MDSLKFHDKAVICITAILGGAEVPSIERLVQRDESLDTLFQSYIVDFNTLMQKMMLRSASPPSPPPVVTKVPVEVDLQDLYDVSSFDYSVQPTVPAGEKIGDDITKRKAVEDEAIVLISAMAKSFKDLGMIDGKMRDGMEPIYSAFVSSVVMMGLQVEMGEEEEEEEEREGEGVVVENLFDVVFLTHLPAFANFLDEEADSISTVFEDNGGASIIVHLIAVIQFVVKANKTHPDNMRLILDDVMRKIIELMEPRDVLAKFMDNPSFGLGFLEHLWKLYRYSRMLRYPATNKGLRASLDETTSLSMWEIRFNDYMRGLIGIDTTKIDSFDTVITDYIFFWGLKQIDVDINVSPFWDSLRDQYLFMFTAGATTTEVNVGDDLSMYLYPPIEGKVGDTFAFLKKYSRKKATSASDVVKESLKERARATAFFRGYVGGRVGDTLDFLKGHVGGVLQKIRTSLFKLDGNTLLLTGNVMAFIHRATLWSPATYRWDKARRTIEQARSRGMKLENENFIRRFLSWGDNKIQNLAGMMGPMSWMLGSGIPIFLKLYNVVGWGFIPTHVILIWHMLNIIPFALRTSRLLTTYRFGNVLYLFSKIFFGVFEDMAALLVNDGDFLYLISENSGLIQSALYVVAVLNDLILGATKVQRTNLETIKVFMANKNKTDALESELEKIKREANTRIQREHERNISRVSMMDNKIKEDDKIFQDKINASNLREKEIREELRKSREELRKSREELQSSREELQSSQQELNDSQQELRARKQELREFKSKSVRSDDIVHKRKIDEQQRKIDEQQRKIDEKEEELEKFGGKLNEKDAKIEDQSAQINKKSRKMRSQLKQMRSQLKQIKKKNLKISKLKRKNIAIEKKLSSLRIRFSVNRELSRSRSRSRSRRGRGRSRSRKIKHLRTLPLAESESGSDSGSDTVSDNDSDELGNWGEDLEFGSDEDIGANGGGYMDGCKLLKGGWAFLQKTYLYDSPEGSGVLSASVDDMMTNIIGDPEGVLETINPGKFKREMSSILLSEDGRRPYVRPGGFSRATSMAGSVLASSVRYLSGLAGF